VSSGPSSAAESAKADTKPPAAARLILRSRAIDGRRPTTTNSMATTIAVTNASKGTVRRSAL
jgi:hypothetical protein